MNSSEKKTIYNVLGLYLISTLSIVFMATYSYYLVEKEKLNQNIEKELFKSAKDIFSNIKTKHMAMGKSIEYPRFDEFSSSIYDIDNKLIFGEFEEEIDFEKQFYLKDDYYYYILPTSQYYLGAANIVVKKKANNIFEIILDDISLILLIVFLVIIFTSLFLVKLILKPIRDNLNLLDRFIKDTTHELNTPVSTILTNIELLQKSENIDDKQTKKISRIKSASLTISNLYEDLVYLTLNNRLQTNNTNIKINEIIENRIEYFSSIFNSKLIKVEFLQNDEAYLNIDRKKIERVIDNLLSNAKKYSPKNSKILVQVDKNSFTICDEGQGMSSEQIRKIHERYARFDSVQGGFGIGFNIIYNIAKEYDLNIKIDSKLKEGTCIKISW